MTDMKYREWINWDGGECPVSPDTWVEVHCYSGDYIGPASQHDWSSNENILRYRLCAPDEWRSSTQPDGDGWIEWHGGERPVPTFVLVEVRYRWRPFGGPTPRHLNGLQWDHQGRPDDIVAYRVVSPAPNNTVNTPSQNTTKKLTDKQLDEARWRRANRTHPDNYACAGQEAARLARIGWEPGLPWEDEARALLEEIRANYRGCSPGSLEENLKGRINVLLKDPHND